MNGTCKSVMVELQENGILRDVKGDIVGRRYDGKYVDGLISERNKLKHEKTKLQDFAIWLTGCGYDFCQHDYFIKKRDELLIKE